MLSRARAALYGSDPDSPPEVALTAGLEEPWREVDEALERAEVRRVGAGAARGIVVTPRAIFGLAAEDGELMAPGIPALLRRLRALGAPIAMLGGTERERQVATQAFPQIALVAVAGGDYQAAVESARQTLGVTAVMVLRTRGDPIVSGADLIVDLMDLAQFPQPTWAALLRDLPVTVQRLKELNEANRRAADLLRQA